MIDDMLESLVNWIYHIDLSTIEWMVRFFFMRVDEEFTPSMNAQVGEICKRQSRDGNCLSVSLKQQIVWQYPKSLVDPPVI